MKRKRQKEQQQQRDLAGHPTSAIFVSNLENIFTSAVKRYPGNKGAQQ